jgi:hypothetical protein
MSTTTGADVYDAIEWLREELKNKKYGTVLLKICCNSSKIISIERQSVDTYKNSDVN